MKNSLEMAQEILQRIGCLDRDGRYEEVVVLMEETLKDFGNDVDMTSKISSTWQDLLIFKEYRPFVDRLIDAVQGTVLMSDFLVLDSLSQEYNKRYVESQGTDIALLDEAIKYRALCIEHISDSARVLQHQNVLGDLYVKRWIDYDDPSAYTKAYNTYLITKKAGRGMGRIENLLSIKEQMESSDTHIGSARLAEQLLKGQFPSEK